MAFTQQRGPMACDEVTRSFKGCSGTPIFMLCFRRKPQVGMMRWMAGLRRGLHGGLQGRPGREAGRQTAWRGIGFDAAEARAAPKPRISGVGLDCWGCGAVRGGTGPVLPLSAQAQQGRILPRRRTAGVRRAWPRATLSAMIENLAWRTRIQYRCEASHDALERPFE